MANHGARGAQSAELHACRGADLVHNVPAGVFEHAPDAAELERWAQSRWEVSGVVNT